MFFFFFNDTATTEIYTLTHSVPSRRSSDLCVIARGRSAREEAWTPYPGVRIQPQPDGSVVRAAHLPGPVALADVVEPLGDGRFLLRGRKDRKSTRLNSSH